MREKTAEIKVPLLQFPVWNKPIEHRSTEWSSSKKMRTHSFVFSFYLVAVLFLAFSNGIHYMLLWIFSVTRHIIYLRGEFIFV